jgi:hypothetical protein
VKEKQLCEVTALPKSKENKCHIRHIKAVIVYASIHVIRLFGEGVSMTLSLCRLGRMTGIGKEAVVA